MISELAPYSCREDISIYGMVKARPPCVLTSGMLSFTFKCNHKEQCGCKGSKCIIMECSSWEPAALQAQCAKAKLSSLGSENADVVRDTVFKTIVPHTCIRTQFDSKEDLCHYVLQQVLLNKPLLPNKGMYQKLDICETIAFCEKNFQYNAASTKV